MSSRGQQFDGIAALFTYPRSDYKEAVEHAAAWVGSLAPGLAAFVTDAGSMPLAGLQELYTNTFDLQPSCSLDLGWHLFGEDYRRGVLLARMRRELHTHGVTESCELPDHLSHALLLLARMEDPQAADFAAAVVMPALVRMLTSLPAENPFKNLLRAVQQLIMTHFAEPQPELVSKEAEGAVS